MSGGGDKRQGRTERLLIFTAFVAGSTVCQWILKGETPLDGFFPLAWLYALLLGATAVLAASMLGIALLPICAFMLGGLTGRCSALFVSAWLSGAAPDPKGLIFSAVAVPLFFMIAVQGMRSSQLLGAMLDNCAAAVRAQYHRTYLSVAVAAAAVYWILGIYR